MKRLLLAALLLGAATLSAAAEAQQTPNVNQSIPGQRLALAPTRGSLAAGVLPKAPTAAGAIRDNATRMERVIAALRSAGIAERDIQTSSVSLNPEYVYENNKAPRLTGYTANNTVTIRFRDIRSS